MEMFAAESDVREEDIALHRIPFFLEPRYLEQPEGWSESHTERMVRKFGSQAAFDRVKKSHRLMPRANQAGLDEEGWSEEKLARRQQSSTLRAHRLVLWIDEKRGWQAAEEAYKALGHEHFVEGQMLNDMAVLRGAASAAGVDADEAEAYLRSPAGEDEVLTRVDHAHSLGIHSIPTLIVDGELLVSGAADAEEVLSTLRSARRTGGRVFAPRDSG